METKAFADASYVPTKIADLTRDNSMETKAFADASYVPTKITDLTRDNSMETKAFADASYVPTKITDLTRRGVKRPLLRVLESLDRPRLERVHAKLNWQFKRKPSTWK